MNHRLLAAVLTGLAAALSLLIWVQTGNPEDALAHAMVIPILLAAIRYGPAGVLLATLTGGAVVGVAHLRSGDWGQLAVSALHILIHACLSLIVAFAFQEVRRGQARLQNTVVQTAVSLINTLEASDRHTGGHSVRVAVLSTQLGEALGLSKCDIWVLRFGGLLHDIGKVAVPGGILSKPGPLTPEEMEVVRSHAATGDQILAVLDYPDADKIRDIVRHHHERLDGTGYPDGLKGEQISLLARIVAVADVYDALTSPRPYREAMSPREAMALLEEMARADKLDRRVVGALVEQVVPSLLGEATGEHTGRRLPEDLEAVIS